MVIERMELRRLTLENEDSHTRFMNITSTSPDAIICSDSKNRIISWNNSAELIFGHRSEDAMGKPLDIIIPPEMRSRHHAGLSRVAAGGPASIIGKSINLTAIHRDGHTLPIELSLSQWTYAGEPQFGAIIRDITQRVEADKLLKHAAEYDHLTGLANRSTLKRRIKEACDAQLSAAILLIDLDGFKDVNDTLGHAAGDFVLKVTSHRLREHVPACHMVSRLGGDEFVVFLSDTADPDKAIKLGLALIAVIEEPIEFEDNSIYIGASIGVSVRSGADYDDEQMLGNADLALYQAKSDGRSWFAPSPPSIDRPLQEEERSAHRCVRHGPTKSSSFTTNLRYDLRMVVSPEPKPLYAGTIRHWASCPRRFFCPHWKQACLRCRWANGYCVQPVSRQRNGEIPAARNSASASTCSPRSFACATLPKWLKVRLKTFPCLHTHSNWRSRKTSSCETSSALWNRCVTFARWVWASRSTISVPAMRP